MRGSRRVGQALQALVVLMVIAGGVPLLLGRLAAWRFGSAVPWAGLSWPTGESLTQWGGSLAGRVTDEMIVDLTVRVAVLMGWVCVVLLLASLAAEIWHLRRHGIPRAVEGPGPQWSRRLVRSVAGGLLVMVPLAGSVVSAASQSGVTSAPVGVTAMQISSPQSHIVRSGETLWEIAEQRLGDPLRWGEIWAANRDQVMADGRVFNDPHLIIPGWALTLPETATGLAPTVTSTVAPHVTADEPRPWDPSSPSPVEVRSGTGIPRLDPPGMPYLGSEVLPRLGVRTPMSQETFAEVSSPIGSQGLSETAEPEVNEDGSAEIDDASDVEEFDPFPERSSFAEMLVGLAGATMLATGILAGIAGRRRSRLRAGTAMTRPSPLDRFLLPRSMSDPADCEDTPETFASDDLEWLAGGVVLDDLRQAADSERILRLDLVLRMVSVPLMTVDQAISAVWMDAQGTIEILTTAPVDLEPPFMGSGRRWVVPSAVDLEDLIDAAADTPQPSPALVHLGNAEDGREVYVDLEVIGVLSLGGHDEDHFSDSLRLPERPELHAVLRAVQLMLVHSPFGQDLWSVWVGEGCPVWPDPQAEGRAGSVEVCESFAAAEEVLQNLTGVSGGPRVVILGAAHGLDGAPGWVWEGDLIVIGSGRTPATGATLTLRGDRWVLGGPVMDGEEILLNPVGVSAAEAAELAELVEEEMARAALVYRVEAPSRGVEAVEGPAHGTVVPAPDLMIETTEEPLTFRGIMVRVMGPVDVVNSRGESARFTRSKSLELLAWCVTHRSRSTRGAARTALWESDVRDSTFTNIVSEARRATTQLQAPAEGRPWLHRTLTEELVIDAEVTSDAEILRATLRQVDDQGIEPMVAEAERAVSMIRGMPFEGTTYLWPEAEGISSDLIMVATSLAALLAIYHLKHGDVAGVFRATAAGLLALPGHEELIALRMRAHARVGDLAGVKQEWTAYQRVIARDPWSGGEPAPKLLALSRELLGLA